MKQNNKSMCHTSKSKIHNILLLHYFVLNDHKVRLGATDNELSHVRTNGVVPFAMKFLANDFDGGQSVHAICLT